MFWTENRLTEWIIHPCKCNVERWIQNQTSYKVWEWFFGRLPQARLRKFWMLVTATHSESKWSIMSLASMNKFFPNYLLMCFNKKMLSMVRTLNVEFHMFFLNAGVCYRCVVPSSDIHGLVSSVSLCGSWCRSDWVYIAFPKSMCSFLFLKKIHLARLFPGKYCFASLATELGCLGFQGAGMVFGTWQFLVVTDGSGMRPDRCS